MTSFGCVGIYYAYMQNANEKKNIYKHSAQPSLSAVTKVLVRMCNAQSGMKEC